jgi:hypothetical protein
MVVRAAERFGVRQCSAPFWPDNQVSGAQLIVSLTNVSTIIANAPGRECRAKGLPMRRVPAVRYGTIGIHKVQNLVGYGSDLS